MSDKLSSRERQIVLFASEGVTDKEIALILHLSQRTVGTYWERIRYKIGGVNRTQIVAILLREEASIKINRLLSELEELRSLLEEIRSSNKLVAAS